MGSVDKLVALANKFEAKLASNSGQYYQDRHKIVLTIMKLEGELATLQQKYQFDLHDYEVGLRFEQEMEGLKIDAHRIQKRLMSLEIE